MTGNPDLKNHSAEGGRARQRQRLTLDKVQEAIGKLETPEDAQRILLQLLVWSAAGMMRPGLAGAAVRAVETWTKAHEVKMLRDRVQDLERRNRDLTKAVNQLKGVGE